MELRDYRCSSCNHLLFKGDLSLGARVQIKCSRHECGHMMEFGLTAPDRLEPDGQGGFREVVDAVSKMPLD